MSYTGKFKGEVKIVSIGRSKSKVDTVYSEAKIPVRVKGDVQLDSMGRTIFRPMCRRITREVIEERYIVQIKSDDRNEAVAMSKSEISNLVGKKTARRLFRDFKEDG